MKRIAMLILIAILLVPASAMAANPAANPTVDKLDATDVEKFASTFFQQKEVQDQLAGALLVVVQDGKVLLNKGYGYADIAAKKPVDAHKTVFRLASVSKLFTSVGIMQLAEAGKVDLDADVQAYLPDLIIPNNTGSPLTLKHLMTHTSGFNSGNAPDPEKAYTLGEFVKATVPTVIRKPGEAYSYNNYAFTLQGYIIEKATGLSFQDYMTKKLFEPLDMDDSSFLFSDKVKLAIATPYDSSLKQASHTANQPDSAPEGGMFSTGDDMAKFLLAMVNGGSFGNQRILTEGSVQAMEKKSVTINPDIPGNGYGLESIYSKYYNGYTVVEKGGDLPGFHTNLWLLPGQNTGIFLALNSDKGNLREPFFQQFMNRYYPKTGEGPAFSKPEPTKQQLLRFEGLYQDMRLPAWHYDITAEDGVIIVEDSLGRHTLRQAGDLLFYDEDGLAAGFKQDASKNVVYFFYNNAGSWSEKLPDPPRFNDVTDDHPYAKYIYKLVQLGAIQGGAASFEPAKPITRGQFIAQIMPLSGYPLTTNTSSFTDTAGSPYEKEIQTALEGGIIQGYPGGKFGPDQPLTREQAATFIWRLVKYGLSAAPVQADLKGPVSWWASEGVQYVVGRHLFGPDVELSDGPVDYRPHDNMLNQEAAALLYMLVNKLRG